MSLSRILAALLAASWLGAWNAGAGAVANAETVEQRIQAHVYKPAKVTPTAGRIDQLKLPEGFSVEVFAKELGSPRMLEPGPDNSVYVTRPESGDVLRLADTDGDGVADEQSTVAERPLVHGIAVDEETVYLATVHEVLRGRIGADGSFEDLEAIIDGLPAGGQHSNRTIGLGQDNMLYVSVGSLANAFKAPASEQTAALLRAKTDGSLLRVYARGLRNTVGFDWHPESGDLWGMDHGIDWLGDDRPPEELNLLQEGEHYGWPWVWGHGNVTPQVDEPEGMSKEEFAEKKAKAPILTYLAHAAPIQMAFYDGERFPKEYQGDAFVAMHGSWNRKPPVGYEVVRIDFEGSKPRGIESFLSGFLVKEQGEYKQFGRPAGVAVVEDGSLLVGDDSNGMIYRIRHGR